jgi:hypothetical protein
MAQQGERVNGLLDQCGVTAAHFGPFRGDPVSRKAFLIYHLGSSNQSMVNSSKTAIS